MPLFAEQLPWNPVLSVELLAVSACAAMWIWMAAQWWQGRSVIAYQPRRPVPWHATDLALVVVVYLAVLYGFIELSSVILGPEAAQGSAVHGPGESTTEHIVGQLIAKGNVWVLLLCGISATIVAPVSEEFFFRVLLQGWLEAVQHRWRRQILTLRRLVPNGAGPIVLTSLLFARMHFRVDAPQFSARFLIALLAGDAIARLLALAFAVGWLRGHVGATAADLGWAPEETLGDIKLGLAAFLALAVPIYAMQLGLRCRLPEYIAPDPVPLFFFALALGVVYARTHRLAPLIVLHAALNGTSLALVWLAS
jgi:membrane protease YdiL (CAAX protease family)